MRILILLVVVENLLSYPVILRVCTRRKPQVASTAPWAVSVVCWLSSLRVNTGQSVNIHHKLRRESPGYTKRLLSRIGG